MRYHGDPHPAFIAAAREVGLLCNVTMRDLTGSSRVAGIVRARELLCAALIDLGMLTRERIGLYLQRDQSSITVAYNRFHHNASDKSKQQCERVKRAIGSAAQAQKPVPVGVLHGGTYEGSMILPRHSVRLNKLEIEWLSIFGSKIGTDWIVKTELNAKMLDRFPIGGKLDEILETERKNYDMVWIVER